MEIERNFSSNAGPSSRPRCVPDEGSHQPKFFPSSALMLMLMIPHIFRSLWREHSWPTSVMCPVPAPSTATDLSCSWQKAQRSAYPPSLLSFHIRQTSSRRGVYLGYA